MSYLYGSHLYPVIPVIPVIPDEFHELMVFHEVPSPAVLPFHEVVMSPLGSLFPGAAQVQVMSCWCPALFIPAPVLPFLPPTTYLPTCSYPVPTGSYVPSSAMSSVPRLSLNEPFPDVYESSML